MDMQSEVLGKRCRYTFQEEDYIGRGTFGIVYRANITEPGDLIGDQDIAVKIIHLHKESAVLATTENWNKWRRRMEFLLTFQHDHLARYHQVSVARSSAFGGVSVKLMMDYYAGGNLTNLLTNPNVLELPTVIRYATELADGVSYLHVNNIIHGDIKPGNVLVHRQDNQNRLLIGDLDDLVQMQQSATCSGDICNIRGTLRYMSPEMLKMYLNLSVDKVGRKSDIWSLGCVILEMINNAVGITKRKLYRAPDIGFDADKIPDSRYAALIMDGYAPLIALSIPVHLAECISSCLTESTSLRIQSSSLLDKLLSLRRLIEQQNQPLSAVAVGIHLGLSHSSVVVCRNGRLEVVTEPHQHEPQIPSFIAFDQTSESGTKILCGQEAMDHQEVDPKQCVYNLQRIIGLRFKHKRVTAQKNVATYNIVNEDGIPRIQIIERGGATTYSAEEITSLLFNNLMRLAESISAISACQTKKVVITVPTYFTVAERRAIKLAAAMAGIERVRLIDDALAAVIPCIRNFGPGKRYILVLELERQQLIVSIVKLSNNNADLARVSLHSSIGDVSLGEKDFDERIAEHLAGVIENIYSVESGQNDRILNACKQIDGCDRQTIEIPWLHGRNFSMSVTPLMVESLCVDLFHKIIDPVKKALECASLTATDVTDAIIVGCGRFVPQISDVLLDLFPVMRVHVTVDPRIAIAEGAALAANSALNVLDGMDQGIEIEQQVPYAIIVQVRGQRKITVIPRWSSLPTEKVLVFTTSADNQRVIYIYVYEEIDTVKKFISMYRISGITPAPKGSSLTVKFTIDLDEELTITAAHGAKVLQIFRCDSPDISDWPWEMFYEITAQDAREALEETLLKAQQCVSYDDEGRGARVKAIILWFNSTRDLLHSVQDYSRWSGILQALLV